jgi:nucleotide-binding universal stress UspA family protein
MEEDAARSVVAGVDLTPASRRVVERARLLAADQQAALQLISVSEPVQDAFISEGLGRLLHQHRLDAVNELATWCRSRGAEAVTAIAVKGAPAWELARAAKQAAVVVVGSSSIDAGYVGPVARQVSRMAASNVVVVRRQPRSPYRRVVAGVDFSELSKRAVDATLDLAPGADITIVFSLPTRFDPVLVESGLFAEEVEASRATRLSAAREVMEEFAANWPGRVTPLVVDGPPLETLAEVVRRAGADLVAVASRGSGATKMTLLGTVAEGLLEVVPTDVLVARVPGEFRRP